MAAAHFALLDRARWQAHLHEKSVAGGNEKKKAGGYG
jgi:hypothetical protein